MVGLIKGGECGIYKLKLQNHIGSFIQHKVIKTGLCVCIMRWPQINTQIETDSLERKTTFSHSFNHSVLLCIHTGLLIFTSILTVKLPYSYNY